MQLFQKNWYNSFLTELKKTKKLRIVSPFINDQVVRKIQTRFDFTNFELITRFNLRDFASGVSNLESLQFAIQNGAQVFGIKGLHSKIYLFDNRAAIITSANLTNGGLINNHECGILVTDAKILKSLHQHFNELKDMAGSPLSGKICEQWLEELGGVVIEKNSLTSLPDYGAADFIADEGKAYYVKFFGSAKLRAPYTWHVKEEINRSLSHYACGFSLNKKPRRINDGDIIYLARMVSPNDYAIFGKAEAIKFIESRDTASKADKLERPYKNDYPIYLRIRNCTFIDATLGDCVLLYDLIKAIGPQSFPTTKAAFDNGEQNINPNRSLNQQPYVRLTPEAVNWLEPRFQDALERFSKVDKSFLASLPQSRVTVK
jgi:hypothetical protein